MRSAIKPRDGVVARAYKNGDPVVFANSFGPASGYSYDILVHADIGDITYEGVGPANDRPTVDIRPASPGSPVLISYDGDDPLFVIFEQPYYEEACDTPAAATAQGSLIGGLLRFIGLGGTA